MALANIDNIVIVLLENRSFDHVLGYLSLRDAKPNPLSLNGLRDNAEWLASFANTDSKGVTYQCHPLSKDVQTIGDPPHDLADIATQINTPTNDQRTMGGFVRSYEKSGPSDLSTVMGFYKDDAVPMFDFFARNFSVCDNWFSPLPTGTQANRLVAMSGESGIADNVSSLSEFPQQPLVYDWLSEHSVDWCSYQYAGFPFFALMRTWWPRMFASMNDPFGGGRFRRFEWFAKQWKTGELLPSVIFIEPKYTDDVVNRIAAPNDDHSPTGVGPGQLFLKTIYETLISSPTRWAKTLLIITYDEHGGFFDHVPPLKIPALAGTKKFSTTGPRVPAFIVSPHVEAGKVCSLRLDHTSILQLLADRFGGGAYSKVVRDRQQLLEPLKDFLLSKPRTGAGSRPTVPASTKAETRLATAQANTEHAFHPVNSSATAQAFKELGTPSV